MKSLQDWRQQLTTRTHDDDDDDDESVMKTSSLTDSSNTRQIIELLDKTRSAETTSGPVYIPQLTFISAQFSSVQSSIVLGGEVKSVKGRYEKMSLEPCSKQ